MKKFLIVVIPLFLLLAVEDSLAKTDLSITATDITFSKEEPVEGDKVRIFARVFNVGDIDIYGFVIFSMSNGQEIADPQPISVKVNTYDDVFIDWPVEAGTYNIQAKIIGTNPADENPDNNIAARENYFVDLDTDKDGLGNSQDLDDDNDGLTDEDEIVLGTNPLNPDSDGDKARDNIDAFPLDPSEWQDTDKDGLGNNIDTDDDNDGLLDEEELFVLGTNPLNPDSDDDGLSDKEEITLGTNPLQPDSDEDGVIDSEDDFPLDPLRVQASIGEIVEEFLQQRGLSLNRILIGLGLIFLFFLFLFLFFRKK